MLSLTLSALGLAALAVALPFLLGRVLPEGAGWLFVNAAVSAVAMLLVAMGYFVFAYAGGYAGALFTVFGKAPGTALHFLRLGALSSMIWLPVLALAIAAQPGRWKEKVW